MARYLRNRVPGGTYFFTVVTDERRDFLTSEMARRCLRKALQVVRRRWPFTLFAISLLPDHLHAVWTLPPGDANYSLRWQKAKELFTRSYLAAGGTEAAPKLSRVRHQERSIWQRRFWEHTCRNDADLKRCVDYLHWNPVKHGLVERVTDWPWSSFHRFVRVGEYPTDWGGKNPCPGFELPEPR